MSEKRTIGSSDAFGRLTGSVYWYIVVEVAFALAGLPGIVGIVLLEPAPSNIPLFALCLVPIMPAFSAAISALRSRARSDQLDPWRQYWRRWVANVRDSLFVSVPALAVLALLGFNIAFGRLAGAVFVVIAIILGAVVALWFVHALVIVSLFSFRLRDTARLAIFYVLSKPLVTLGVIALGVIAAAIALVTSPWVLIVLGSIFAGLVLVNARAMIADIEARFVESS